MHCMREETAIAKHRHRFVIFARRVSLASLLVRNACTRITQMPISQGCDLCRWSKKIGEGVQLIGRSPA